MIEELPIPEGYRRKIDSVFLSTDPFTDAAREDVPVRAVLSPSIKQDEIPFSSSVTRVV
jgi:hypothetical protein